MTDPAWPSTKGLSVYNALKLGGDMTRGQLFAYLREHWDPAIAPEYIDAGVAFIAEKNWASEDVDGVHLLTRPQVAERSERDLVLAMPHSRKTA
jgi:hypothetical protein